MHHCPVAASAAINAMKPGSPLVEMEESSKVE
jgi:hypothetical protein